MTYAPLKRPERTTAPPKQASVADRRSPRIIGPTADSQHRLPASLALSAPIQAKLKVGAVHDPLEHEADAIAERVVSGLQGTTSKTPPTSARELIQRQCETCDSEEEEAMVQRTAATTSPAPAASSGLASQLHQARQGGRPLEIEVRRPMERGFGTDFSQVNVHTDDRAATLSQQLNARAFTTGNDVFFNLGEFRPQQTDGKRLLAHELSHVVQQRGAIPVVRRKEKDRPGDTASVIWARRVDGNGKLARWTKYLAHGKFVALLQMRARRAQQAALEVSAEDGLKARLQQFIELAAGRPATADGENQISPVTDKDPVVEETTREEVTASERPRFFEDDAAWTAARELVSNFGLKYVTSDTQSQWSAEYVADFQRAFAAVSSPVQTQVLGGLAVTLWAAFSAHDQHTAEMFGECGDQELRVSKQDWGALTSAGRVEAVLHEVGHGLAMCRPGLSDAFWQWASSNAMATDDVGRVIGGALFESYLTATDAGHRPHEFFAHVYAVSVIDPGRLPKRLQEWARKHLP